MSGARVIGIGSPFGADRLGWMVLDAIERQAIEVPGMKLEFVRLDRPGPALMDAIKDATAAVLVDALWMDRDVSPGRVRELGIHQLQRAESPSSHGLGVADALALARVLGELPEKLLILGVEADPEADNKSLDELVPRVAREIAGRISGFLGGGVM